MATTIRTAKQAKIGKKKATKPVQTDHVRAGEPASAGKTKSILDVLQSTGLSRRKATTIRAGGGGRAARTRGGVNPFSRANTSSNSISH